MSTKKKKATTDLAKKKKDLDRELAAAQRDLDRVRTENDPEPEKVLAAILGWWNGITCDVDRVASVLRKFESLEKPYEYRPGFEWAKETAHELGVLLECLDRARPAPRHRSTDELIAEVREMLHEQD